MAITTAVILSGSGKASSCADAADGGAGKMVLIGSQMVR